MSDEFNEMIEAKAVLEEGLTILDENGRPVLQVALLVTVYFDDQYKRHVREAAVSCCEDYFRRCGEHLRWAWNPDTKRMERYSRGKGSRPRDWVLDLGEDKSFQLTYHGAQYDLGASMFDAKAYGARRYPYDQLGHFRVAFPLPWFFDHPGSLPEVMLEICRKLKPVSGYGGIGIIGSPDYSLRPRQGHIVYELAQRFPGLEVDEPVVHGLRLTKGREGNRPGIKGVNWLTVVSDRFLAELGGADTVQAELAALDRRFVVHRFDGGLLIQAGDHPELGDAQRKLWPELYVKLAKYVKPIRITKHGSFHGPGIEPRFDPERSEAWLRRFDTR